jgi:hypothetical protein
MDPSTSASGQRYIPHNPSLVLWCGCLRDTTDFAGRLSIGKAMLNIFDQADD